MSECPSCRTVFERQPRFCENCGYQFATDPKANPAPAKRTGRKWVFGGLGVFAVLWFLGTLRESPQRESPQTVDTIGATAVVRKSDGFWPCGSTEAAYTELMKWATRGDNTELKRTMRTTGSFALFGGMKVKVLDIGFGKRRVRVLTNDAGEAYLKDEKGVFPADPRIGRECWVILEALAPTPSSVSTSDRPAPPDSQKTSLKERMRAAANEAEEAQKANAALPERVRQGEVGVITTVVGSGASWPCASSKVALTELMKWHKAMLDEQAPDSVMNNLADTLMQTRSIMVEPRTQVKILEEKPGVRKVTIIDRKAKFGSGYMAVAAQGCWMASEAVTR